MNTTPSETLDRILADLQSEDRIRQLAALRDLWRLNYSSEAIVLQLEQLAVHGNPAVRAMALEALDSRQSQYVRSQLIRLSFPERLAILAEAEDWADRGLIGPETAEVLKRRYDSNRKPVLPAALSETAAPQSAPAGPMPASAATPLQESAPPPQASAAAPLPASVAVPASPSLTLSERLLSQTTINIALYLGAFLVVGAAAILAALVEATRLPILLGATLLFAAGAITIKRRLPQPSFILFMVFSFLLPISAGVAGDALHLPAQGRNVYWAVVFLGMALVWGFGTWFYSSRLFSLTALVAWVLAVYRLGILLGSSHAWDGGALILAAMGALAAVHVLRAWKNDGFALPLLLAAQCLTIGALLWSLSYTMLGMIGLPLGAEAPQELALASSLTAVAGAAFYVWSSLQYPFPLFPWAAAACLLPVSWLFLRSFDSSSLTQSLGLWVWGLAFSVGAESTRRRAHPAARGLHAPLLLGTFGLFSVAVAGAFLANWQDNTSLTYVFGVALGAALVYAAMTALHPRFYVWLAALLFGLTAYFTFFALPIIASANIYMGYRLLGACLLLLGPELSRSAPFTSRDAWRWPPVLLGGILAAINILLLVFAETSHTADRAIIMAVYALLFAAYGVHMRRPTIGYLATASAATALAYALRSSALELQLAVLTGLSVLFFLAGFLLRGARTQDWGSVLRLSGLALGTVVTAVALAGYSVFTRTAAGTQGYDLLVIAILFFAEAYIRSTAPMEAGGPLFASFAAYLLLRRFGLMDLPFHFFAVSLIWLGSDLLYSRTMKQRNLPAVTRWIGGLLALGSLLLLLVHGYEAGHPGTAAVLFAAYAAFFAVSAWLYRQPRITYASAGALALCLLLALKYGRFDAWAPALTALAAAYFGAGYLLRKDTSSAWGSVMRISGLAVAGAVTFASVILLKHNVAWCALLTGALYLAEPYIRDDSRLELGGPLFLSAAAFLALRDLHIMDYVYHGLAVSLVWLAADLLYGRTLRVRPLANATRFTGAALAAATSLALIALPGPAGSTAGAIGFGIYAVFLALYAWLRAEPRLGYAAAAALPLAAFFLLRALRVENWLYAVGLIALLYYAAGYLLRRRGEQGWSAMLLLSGLILGVVNSLSAPLRGGLDSALPVAVAATMLAAEAFSRRNIWLGFPTNALYLESYFLILTSLKVDQPQFFSVGAALLGLLMHYLLTRSGSRQGAFLTGMVSQLVLLGTTFVQLLSTEQLAYFVVIFFQGMAVLAYGIVARSRSLVIAPIVFIVVSVTAVLYTALKGIGTVVLIGGAGIILLLLGITAVVLRGRIVGIGERLSDWQA